MPSPTQGIRINLRFGARTEPSLLKALIELDPSQRAHWVRGWVTEGWRQHQKSQRPSSPGIEPTVPQAPSSPEWVAPPKQEIISVPKAGSPTSQDSLEDGILGFIGRRIL